MVMWRKIKLFIGQNVLLCDLAIVFVSQRLSDDTDWILAGHCRNITWITIYHNMYCVRVFGISLCIGFLSVEIRMKMEI